MIHRSAPRQSETTSALLFMAPLILSMLSRIKWMAISPSKSPWYAFATRSDLENDPIRPPNPLLHSNTNAVEHRFGYCSRMYQPSVTAMREPSCNALCSQLHPPAIEMLSHSHVLPHEYSPSMNVQGVWGGVASFASDVSLHPPPTALHYYVLNELKTSILL